MNLIGKKEGGNKQEEQTSVFLIQFKMISIHLKMSLTFKSENADKTSGSETETGAQSEKGPMK